MKNLKEKLMISREKAISWLKSMEVPEYGFGVRKASKWHNIKEDYGMLLPATYNTTHCAILLGMYDDITENQKNQLIKFFESFRNGEGIYKIPEMLAKDIWKRKNIEYSQEYVDFHITNYTMGAISSLNQDYKHNFKFVEKYRNIEELKYWLSLRMMDDPWLEGNNIVNLASFYFKMIEQGEVELKENINYLLNWHNLTQDPKTGYWGTNLEENPATQLYGMAGAAHNYHIYFMLNEPIKYYKEIIDYCINFSNQGVLSACLDIDVVDILVNMLKYGYKEKEIKETLKNKLEWLLEFQNEDGGFCDVKDGIRRMDGWVRGYWEPQGESNDFATWFRMATIGMCAVVLFPEMKDEWHFRNTIGIGYLNKEYLRNE